MAAAIATTQAVAAEEPAQAFDDEFTPLDRLEELGVNKGDLKKCKDAGYFTAESMLMETKKKLNDIKGLSEAKLDNVLAKCRTLATNFGLMSAKDYDAQRERQIVHISTGCAEVDALLKGGIETKAITEIFGEWRCGKTQLCHMLCVTAQINEKSGGKVCYIDTENTFRPSKLRPIAERFGVDPDEVLDNVLYCKALTHEAQIDVLPALAAKMMEEPFKLIIYDSIMANFRVDFQGRGELAERQMVLGSLMSKLKKLAETFNCAVVITNQVMSDPGGGMTFVNDPKKPVGGHVLAHASTVRLQVRKGKGDQRLVKVVDAPALPEGEASFCITDEGIKDYKD